MSLYNFIYKLQKKPERSRRQILFGVVAVFFVALIGWWVLMFKDQVSKISSSQNTGVENVLGSEEKLLSPLAALAEGFKGFKSDITQKIGEYKLNSSSNRVEKARPVYKLPEN